MRPFRNLLAGFAFTSLLLTACQSGPMMYQPNAFVANPQLQALRAPQRQLDLVGVQGFQIGDKLKVKGPLWFKGEGKVHNLTPDAFKIEFSISSYHLIVDAVRLDEQKVRFTTIDLKQNRTVEAIGNYYRNGNTTVFDMGPGAEVEKLTIRADRPGYFEADVVQPGKISELDDTGRGSTTLKFTKG